VLNAAARVVSGTHKFDSGNCSTASSIFLFKINVTKGLRVGSATYMSHSSRNMHIKVIHIDVTLKLNTTIIKEAAISRPIMVCWLDVPQRIQFKLGVTVRRCLQGSAPRYLVDYCKSTTDVASRQRLPGSALQVAISSSCHDTVAPSSVVGRFLLQAQQPGTRCQTL